MGLVVGGRCIKAIGRSKATRVFRVSENLVDTERKRVRRTMYQ